jgi:nucleotide-binding universal stress UspA family protein
MSLERILVGTNESQEAAAAARWALAVARAHGARVEFLEAFTGSAEQSPERTEALRLSTRERIKGWVDNVTSAEDPEVVIVHGDAVDAVTTRAGLNDVDLVVVGAKTREGVTPLALGSLPHQLAHHLRCPLVAVPRSATSIGGSTIVVGVDGSDGNRVALRWSVDMAATLRAKVCAVYAYSDIHETFNRDGPYGEDERRAKREVAEARDAGVEFVERSAMRPADALVEVAKERGASLVVVAARERGSMGGLLLGATPDRLIHRPPCPVAVLTHDYLERVDITGSEDRQVQR